MMKAPLVEHALLDEFLPRLWRHWMLCVKEDDPQDLPSLNEIFSGDIETEDGGECDFCGGEGCEMYAHEDIEQFKDHNAQALLEFLETIIKES